MLLPLRRRRFVVAYRTGTRWAWHRGAKCGLGLRLTAAASGIGPLERKWIELAELYAGRLPIARWHPLLSGLILSGLRKGVLGDRTRLAKVAPGDYWSLVPSNGYNHHDTVKFRYTEVPISIKNDQAERSARLLAELTGETITDAIRAAVEERYERLRLARVGRSRVDELNAIALRCAKQPVISSPSDDEILGYDEAGVPTR